MSYPWYVPKFVDEERAGVFSERKLANFYLF